MTSYLRRLVYTGLGAVLCACASRPAPPVKSYTLGMSRADYRDYAGARANPCDAEPRWLSDELTAVNSLLSRFLRETENAARPEAPEHEQHVALLQEAMKTLPPVLAVHRGTLAKLPECGFRRSGAFPEIARRGAELVEAAGTRLTDAPRTLAAAQRKEAVRKWKEEGPAREASARGNWCPEKPQVGQAVAYYVRMDADGRTVAHFCDGHRVEQVSGGEPQLIEPEGLSRAMRRRVQPKAYLDAAANFPPEEMDRHPDLVPAKAAEPTGTAAGAKD
ncbi:hypothetical protein HPC49_36695 [Pyxidicoccus fallax]|uniref:Lipoprotein n=1 Tax=Pyxidicoccus fallax TaxID=394095 RepID=A0A848LT65_9BACT|nr:hypothetical protein [Pyxidicoccus fallax]NMO20881.1 hypothetical protein [Pyxidicoccus fallax]NPC83745.1 hypothetical protein [Pyxidicoccus fallax]